MRALQCWLVAIVVVNLILVVTSDGESEKVKRGAPETPIKFVVTLMMENRSFDHFLGFLKKLNPNIDGLTGEESCPVNPAEPSLGSVKVSPNAPYITEPDPGHNIPQTNVQIFGNESVVLNPAPMNGFILQFQQESSPTPGDIMECFNATSLPSMSTLGMEFSVFDHWYASVPGPTQPNRMYLMSCTSHGAAWDDKEAIALGYPQTSIFKMFTETGITWGSYYSDFPGSLIMRDMRTPEAMGNIKPMDRFYEQLSQGLLPQFSFLEPAYFDWIHSPASDEHPPHDVTYGEYLMADIYEALRASPIWNETLWIITFDEHGGYYDHVPTPQDGIPNPDGLDSNDPLFDFRRLGIRVPMVMVSPWIDKGTVIHEPTDEQKPYPTSHFEHSSVSATLRQLFNIDSAFLTKREAWAATFEQIVLGRDSPRTDCPMTVPRPGSEEQQRRWQAGQMTPRTPATVKLAIEHGQLSPAPLTELQRDFLAMANGLTGLKHDPSKLKTEGEGAIFAHRMLEEWFANGGQGAV